ncbi:hypothetical protein [Nocardia gamkensis]|uniref:hypothetical protein n=1 Tax=Nocardia gamkensis TaxID=352869 RepID=UPI000AC0BC99|nr:hypothetical protein [Nocardia gamkensis]
MVDASKTIAPQYFSVTQILLIESTDEYGRPNHNNNTDDPATNRHRRREADIAEVTYEWKLSRG